MTATALTFTACEKDDDNEDDNQNNNQLPISLGNTDLDLSQGLLEYYGILQNGSNSHNFDILLLSSSFSVDIDNDDISGSGDFLYLESFTPTNQIEAGNYNFTDDYRPFTFDYGEITVDYNIETEEYAKYYKVTGGYYNLSIDGVIYTINLNLQVREADFETEEFISDQTITVTGTYNGTLDFLDQSYKSTTQKLKLNLLRK